jgi:hypothetical protein
MFDRHGACVFGYGLNPVHVNGELLSGISASV